MTNVICQYCRNTADRVTGREIYPHRKDLCGKIFYRCVDCDAYVGCHPGTAEPLGVLANAELRKWKQATHSAFDPIWMERLSKKKAADPKYTKGMARGGRYKKLAELLGISKTECHIGMFDVKTCKLAIEICKSGALNQ